MIPLLYLRSLSLLPCRLNINGMTVKDVEFEVTCFELDPI